MFILFIIHILLHYPYICNHFIISIKHTYPSLCNYVLRYKDMLYIFSELHFNPMNLIIVIKKQIPIDVIKDIPILTKLLENQFI